jgi:sugar phosphate isomerase/epimerase
MTKPFRLAVPTAVYRQPLRLAVQLAAAARADGVQFDLRTEVSPAEFGDTARQQLRHYLQEQRLQIAACTLTTHATLADPDRLDARVAAVRRALEFTRQLGADVLTVRLGRIPPDAASAEHQRLLDVLSDLAAHGNRVGAILALGTLGNSAATLRGLISTIDAGPLGIDLDPAGCIFSGASPTQDLRALHDRLVHFQVRDGVRTADGSGVETAVGAGDVVWDELLATLAECDYRGWLTVRRSGGEDLPGDLARGVQYVRNVLNG